MPASNKVVRQTVGLPADTARHVRSLAKQRRLSANRIIVELVEEGIEARKRKQKEFFDLAERYRAATDPYPSCRPIAARQGMCWAGREGRLGYGG